VSDGVNGIDLFSCATFRSTTGSIGASNSTRPRHFQACAYLADDEHSPLALQEILLTGCPTVGVRTGASLVCHDITGLLVDRLPPGKQCVDNEDDEAALAAYLNAVRRAQEVDRRAVRAAAATEFATDRIVDAVLTALDEARR